MPSSASESLGTRLCSYKIASADMFYSEVIERVIYVSDDPVHGFHLWSMIPQGDKTTAIDLCEVLLEYAMTCRALRDQAQASQDIEAFGKRLGETLAKHVKGSTPARTARNLGACALECVLEAMGAHFIVEQRDAELCYVLDRCPLWMASKRTGLPDVELAHQGLNALCQCLVHTLDPDTEVYVPVDSRADHTFFVGSPALA
ncbi:MAG: hypothetical protein GTO14_06455 [Anaerolineales bacterium]|nr:hypothetical protein [Anaerolineales bacterium]